MSSYAQLRAAVQALVDVPGHITRASVEAILARYPLLPPQRDHGKYNDDIYDPRHYG